MVFKVTHCYVVSANRNTTKWRSFESMSQLFMELTIHPYTHHESSVPPHVEEKAGILNYTRSVLLLGLLRLNHTDAIRMGDGQRIMDIHMYLCLLYKTFKCPKYAYGMLKTIVQIKVLLTERLAHRLVWNRTVNHRGKPDSNHPNDLDLEHQNMLFKDQIHNYRDIFTERGISMVSQSGTIIDK